jgi:hypothetical protein
MLMTSIFISIKFIVQELDYVDSCQENGAFADAKQCDKYFICKNGEVSFLNPFRQNQRGTFFEPTLAPSEYFKCTNAIANVYDPEKKTTLH